MKLTPKQQREFDQHQQLRREAQVELLKHGSYKSPSMKSRDIPAMYAESAHAAQQYQERFGHPPQPYYRAVNPISRLTSEQCLQLVNDALEKGEPVPGWAEAEETQKIVRATNGAIV
jgi:hypothetical protein